MTIALDGTGTLVHSGRVVESYPYTMGVMGAKTATSAANQCWMSTSQTNGDRGARIEHAGSADAKQLYARSPVKNGTISKTTSPHTSTTVLQWMFGVFTSPTDLTLYFGDNVGLNSTAGNTDLDVNQYNQTRIGSYQVNGAAAERFAKMLAAEAHWWSGSLSAAVIGTIQAGTILPEDAAGWIDGLSMKDHQVSGNYLSMTGTRTFVATGGVTQSAVAHPVARVSAPSTINLVGTDTTQGATSSTGVASISVAGSINLVGASTTQGATSSTGVATVTANTATITSDEFYNWANILQASVTIPHVMCIKLDRTVPLSLADQATNGAGRLVLTSSALVAGTEYMLATFNADGSARGMKKYTAA